jgi:septal ring factor EnvC (AmiA/AmiB activator)
MVGTIFSGWLGKVGAAVILALLIVCGLLYWSHTRVTEANASLKADIAMMENVRAEQEETITALTQEKDRIERIMSQRLAAERKIRAQKEAELQEVATRLSQLRKDYEDIEDFLSLPVPDSFVDHWMRGARANGSPDQN